MKNAIISAMLIVVSSAASASNITWKIDGVFTNNGNSNLDQIWGGGTVNQFDTFEILVTFDNASPATVSGSRFNYQSAIQSLQLTVNGHTQFLTVDGVSNPSGTPDEREISLANDLTHTSGYIQDSLSISNVDAMESIYTAGANRHEYLHLNWTDRRDIAEGSDMLDSTDLLLSPDDLSVANYSQKISWGFTDFGTDSYTSVQLQGSILSVTAIPVPAAVWLFASALGLMGAWRKAR
jgi:hypothetical protein